jgi:hypothetical protein
MVSPVTIWLPRPASLDQSRRLRAVTAATPRPGDRGSRCRCGLRAASPLDARRQVVTLAEGDEPQWILASLYLTVD